MLEHLADWFSTERFMPHGMCLVWRADLIWLHVTSDALIALSYFSIPFALVYFVRKRTDLAYPWMFLLPGLCGIRTMYGRDWSKP
jgi:hypothetical protein